MSIIRAIETAENLREGAVSSNVEGIQLDKLVHLRS